MLKLKQLGRRIARDRRGNIGILFAILLLPILAFIGLAIDYSRAALTQTRLQSALDQTALRLVRDGTRLSQGDLEQLAAQQFRASYDATDTISTATVTVVRDGQKIKVRSDSMVAPAVMNVLGQAPFHVSAVSEGAFDDTKIELALVLDNTGSMADNNKIAELKRASTDLLRRIQALNPVGDQFRVSIVPFDTHVKIATRYKSSANFLKFPTAAADYRWDGLANTATWTGCVSDRDDRNAANAIVNFDVKGTPPSSLDPSTLYPGVACPGARIPAVAPLTNDWTSLQNTVDAMTPSGCTNITIGFHWGMQMLASGGTPMSLGLAPAPNVKKFMVFLTDGDNTQNRWVDDCNHNGNTALIDAKTRAVCNEIKANTGIQIFTVGVLTGDAANLLHTCASTAANFFNVQNSSQIGDAFTAIFKQISMIRISS